MLQYRTVVILLLGLLTTGCLSSNHGSISGPLRSNVTGVVLSTTTPGSYAFCDLAKSKLEGRPITTRLKPYRRVETTDPMKIEISQLTSEKDFNYSVVLGPDLSTPDATVGGWLKTSDPIFQLATTGWLFSWGTWPFAATRWVSATATGSTIVLQSVSSSEQRVYFLAGNSVTVRCLRPGSTKSRTWSNVGSYITITPDGLDCKWDTDDPNPAKTIDAPVTPFINSVKAIAKAARWDE